MNIFEDLKLSKELVCIIGNQGISKPTQIQELSIPHIMAGKDVIGESATGSGKTLAFGCGIVDRVDAKKGLQALVLAPTRELAEQVKIVIQKLANLKKLNVISIYGGVSMGPQFEDIKKAEVAVATPGRLLDHLKRRTINLSNIKILVLDEADRMLDMGFIDDIEKIIKLCPKNRQTLFFSATISERIKSLANRYMNHPIKVSAIKMVDPSKLKQGYYNVKRNLKLSLLVNLLQKDRSGLAMVFCNTRNTVDFLVKNLKANQINAIGIHGGLTQNNRTKTIKTFNNVKNSVLICTDVAARGLHVDNVSHVYNFDIPKDPNDYIHRIGRTARAGESGEVINILSEVDYDNFARVEKENRGLLLIRKMEIPKLGKVAIVGGFNKPAKKQFNKTSKKQFFRRRK